MILKFLYSKTCLVIYMLVLLLSCFMLGYYGPEMVFEKLLAIKMWMLGGDYKEFSVLSIAFAMNTWGLAVRSTRQKVRRACRSRVASLISGLRDEKYLDLISFSISKGNLGFWACLWLNIFGNVLKRYSNMTPYILEISAWFTKFFMILSAVISVVCMILGVNGRFAAFLVLPYPLFWCYSKLTVCWIMISTYVPLVFLRMSVPAYQFQSGEDFYDAINKAERQLNVIVGLSPKR